MKQSDLVPLWKALADSKRRRIIQLLGEKTRTTSEISAHFDVSRFAIMHHLKVLEQAELIKTRREGRQRWNFLNEDLFQQIQQTYLADSVNGAYQFSDVLPFLVRQETTGESATADSQPPHLIYEVLLTAPPQRVFQALTDDIDAWWHQRLTLQSEIVLEPQVGGRLYEAFNEGGGLLYAFVTYLKPAEALWLSGSMGVSDEATHSLIQITLRSQTPNTTWLQLTHRFQGLVNSMMVDTFNHTWEELLNQHLKSYIEQGVPQQMPL